MNIRIADNPLIDLCRIITMVMSSVMCGAAVGWLTSRQDTRAERLYIGLIGIFIIAQEAEQLGKPMLVWRMPYLTLLVIVGLYILVKGTRHDRR